LTARSQEQDRIDGLRAGADDYLSKPFNLEELLLRVKAVLRRAQQDPVQERSAELEAGGLHLDCRTFEVTTEGKEGILLTPTEFDLLYYLMSNAGQVFSSDRLLQEVWDFPYDTGSTDLVRAHIKNLRVHPSTCAPYHATGTPSTRKTGALDRTAHAWLDSVRRLSFPQRRVRRQGSPCLRARSWL
jgi:DNA-binding response OmpR family regulator